MSGGGLLVAGTASGVGKSTLVAALCRVAADRGVRVAPFKAQNMSNHSAVTVDGGEVGRAQALQAQAARVPLERRMNPILLKPGADGVAHLVVDGEEVGVVDAVGYGARARRLADHVLGAVISLRADHELVVAEGAGGAAEINLLDRDVVNLPLARAAGLPAIVVVDIDRGGAFAAAYGTVTLLPPPLRAMVRGFVFNRFRGDPSLLTAGIEELEARTGVPVLGVLPHLGPGPRFGVEDSLDVGAGFRRGRSSRPIRIAAIRYPHLANPSDLDPFLVEPHVELRWVTAAEDLRDADLVVLPGSRATVADLAWLRDRGIADALETLDAEVVGLCAGFQMLGTKIVDGVESACGVVPGLGLLDVTTTFRRPKVVRRVRGRCGTSEVAGYEIRFGRPEVGSDPWLELEGEPEGAIVGRVRGTSLHGLFDADGFRAAFLGAVAERRSRDYEPAATGFAAAVDAMVDELASWVEAELDVEALLELAATAPEAPGW